MIPELSYFTRYDKKAFKQYLLTFWGTAPSTPEMTLAREKVLDETWAQYELIKEKVLSNQIAFSFLSIEKPELSGSYLFDETDKRFKKKEGAKDVSQYLHCKISSLELKESDARVEFCPGVGLSWGKWGGPEFQPVNTGLLTNISNTDSPAVTELKERMDVEINTYSPCFGSNPILLAIAKGWNHHDGIRADKNTQKGIITALLARPGLDVNAVDLKNGMSALHIACLRGDDPALIKLLLERGANPLLKDAQGRTPRELLKLPHSEAQAFVESYTGGSLMRKSKKNTWSFIEGTASLLTETERATNISAIESLLDGYRPPARKPSR